MQGVFDPLLKWSFDYPDGPGDADISFVSEINVASPPPLFAKLRVKDDVTFIINTSRIYIE